jgi:hypothetical protein
MSAPSKVIMSPFEPRKVRGYDNGADDDFKESRPLGSRKTYRK